MACGEKDFLPFRRFSIFNKTLYNSIIKPGEFDILIAYYTGVRGLSPGIAFNKIIYDTSGKSFLRVYNIERYPLITAEGCSPFENFLTA